MVLRVGGRQTVSEAIRVEKRMKIYGLLHCKCKTNGRHSGSRSQSEGNEWTWFLDMIIRRSSSK